MCVYNFKWTHENTVGRYKSQWAVRDFLEIPCVHHDSLATYSPVASDSSPLTLLSLIMTHDLHLKQLDVNTAFINSPLLHEVWVRFLTDYQHPFGNPFAKLYRLLHGLRQQQSESDW